MLPLAIYPKDVAQVRRVSYSAGKRHLRRIREQLGRAAGQFVTIAEFCAATGLPEHEVRAAIRA